MVSVYVNGLNWTKTVIPKGSKAECCGCKKMVNSVWRCQAINACLKCINNNKWSSIKDTSPVPVDTINIKREVLQGVRAAFKGLSNMYTYAFDLSDGGLIMMGSHVQKFEDTHRVAQEALASLDAVLSEGKS